jgi:hypothetical protein
MICAATPRARGADQLRRGIHAGDMRTAQGQVEAQHPVAAAQIEDALTALRIKQPRHRAAEKRYEAGVDGVVVGVPALAGGGDVVAVEGTHGNSFRRRRWPRDVR